MKVTQTCVACLLLASLGAADHNPLGEVITLMDSLRTKIVKDGESEASAYAEFFEWCDDASKNAGFDIKTATESKARLVAAISKATDDAEASTGKIEELAASISSDEGDLTSATQIRDKEAADFSAEEAELMGIVDALARAISIIERDMAKNPASFAQIDASSLAGLLKTFSTMVDAASLSTADNQKLTAFVQSQQSTDDDDDAPSGSPAAAAYKTHSSGIFDVLEDLKDKAEDQLAGLRKAESNTKHNYGMLKQSLTDQVAVDTKHMKEEKANKAASNEAKAIAEGDLAVTVKDLTNSNAALEFAHSDCMQTAADHEATVRARDEELKVIAQAKSILQSSTSGAVEQSYAFIQAGSRSQFGAALQTRADLANAEVVSMVKRLAQKHHSQALAQLASRISAVLRFGAGASQDPFAKVKGLIQDMIINLEKTAQSEASEKSYCDEQLAKTEEKKSELDDDIAKLTSKIDVAAARSAHLKEEAAALQSELAALAKVQAEMDKIRSDEKAAFTTAKADLEAGLDGVRKALSLLRDYYGGAAASLLQGSGDGSDAFMQQPSKPEIHSKSAGAGGSIIGILEVVESDFAKNLATEEMTEDSAASEYEKLTQENAVTKTLKDQDVKYKTQEFKGLDKQLADLSGDRDSANAELTAVMEYYGQIKGRCIAKPETYETRQARRQAEIEGLKQALSVLENETAFTQRGRKGAFRGTALQ